MSLEAMFGSVPQEQVSGNRQQAAVFQELRRVTLPFPLR